MKRAALCLLLVSMMPNPVLPAEIDVNTCYEKKATWHETMRAALCRLTALEHSAAEETAPDTPAKPQGVAIGTFQSLPTFKSKGLKHDYGPDKDVANRKWIPKPGWKAGSVVGLKMPGNTVQYVYCTLTVNRKRTVTGYFGSDDGIAVVLNGGQVHLNDAARGVSPNQDTVKLPLQKGTNHLLIKIKNRGGGSGFYFSLDRKYKGSKKRRRGRKTPAEQRRDRLWKMVERDFGNDAAAMREIAVEKNDAVWNGAFTGDGLKTLAGRYAGRTKNVGDLRAQAKAAAAAATDVASLERLRGIYHQSVKKDNEITAVQATIDSINLEHLRMAVEDIEKTYPDRYDGETYLKRIEAYQGTIEQIKADVTSGKGMDEAAKLLSLQREALLANPLMDFEKLLLIDRGNDQGFLVNNWLSNSKLPKGGHDNRIACLSPVSPDGTLHTIFKPEKGEIIADVDLNYDADKMLFSMPENNKWHVFEVKVDGTGLKRMSPDHRHDECYDPCYLPDGRIIFTSTANRQGVPCIGGGAPVANLAIHDPAQNTSRMICFEQDHDWCPTIMPNGRVMYLRWEYTDTPHYFTRILFSCNPDGTDQKEYYGSNSYWPNGIFYARPIPGSNTKFIGIVNGHHDLKREGQLTLFDVAAGRREADGAIQRIPYRGKEVKPLIIDGLVKRVGGITFLHPWPLSDKYFLAASRGPSGGWAIYLVDVFDNMLLIKDLPGHHLVEPVPLVKTPKPRVIQDRIDLTKTSGVAFVTNIYHGPGLKDVPKGTVKKIRLYTYTYTYHGFGGHTLFGIESGWDAKRIIGTAPVEKDGSAMFAVPANKPIAFQPLDENGAALQLMRSWTTVMPGEKVSCIGCHESQNDVPRPVPTIAGNRAVSEITPWQGPERGFGFEREVQPVLDRYCVGCHDGTNKDRPNFTGDRQPAADKRGRRRFSAAYTALCRYVRRPGPESDYHIFTPMEYHGSTSPLIQKLKKGHHNVQLSPEAWEALYAWIDFNAPYHPTWTSAVGKRATSEAQKRRELMKIYTNIDVDPEYMPPAEERDIAFVMPAPVKKPKTPALAGWPFDADTAKQMQGEDAVQKIALGTSRDFMNQIKCTPIPGVECALELVRIPAGRYVMGSVTGEPDEYPQAVVAVDKPFWMATTEVTNAMYSLYDPKHDSRYIDRERKDQSVPGYTANNPTQPVIRVSWQEAMGFCKWLSEKTGKKFTLPTEAQWEWACRAGTNTPMWFGEVDADFGKFANLADASLRSAYKPVVKSVKDGQHIAGRIGAYRPNPWGLKDMHGNVAEWTRSDYVSYPYETSNGRNDGDPRIRKVVRGGSWFDLPQWATSSFRLPYETYQKVHNVGFRVVMIEE